MKKRLKVSLSLLFVLLLESLFFNVVYSQQTSGLMANIITEKSEGTNAAFPIVSKDKLAASIRYDVADFKGVIRAIGDLQNDINSVTGIKPELLTSNPAEGYEIVIGTLGKNKQIDNLASSGRLNTKDLKGKWESFVITTIDNPKKSGQKILVIAGSDKRGTIYGIYELSRQLGVSPWYWWADVPVKKRAAAYVLPGAYASGEPKVKYRGIFINDENPCMKLWAREKFGGMNSKMYSHVFELLLRLRANYLWPGMWGSFTEYEPSKPILKDENGFYEGNSFNEDDPENPKLADEFGIVMGTSHHEPMQRSQQEWIRNKANYGNGEWNYNTNKEGIQKFFREGIEHTKNYESIITMGMRGDDDKPMVDAGSAEANFRTMENIMKDQREIIEKETGKPAAKTPQVWTLYSEVLDYFDKGMKVPDDMMIVLCDNNWGDVRRLPDLKAKRHPGGYGMYYHAGYYGGPRASKWLNVTQIEKMWQQLKLTYDHGVDKIWIVNVGDIKPLEYPMDFFFQMAWNPDRFNSENISQYSQSFCEQQFGKSIALEASNILSTYCKYASRITPEMLDDKTFNLENGEFKMVREEFLALEARALRQFIMIPENYRDTYKELILYPVQALANLYDMYYGVAINKKFAAENDVKANIWADHVEHCFQRDSELTKDFNLNVAHGKWNHIIDQVHIGYTTWHGPQYNLMPKLIRIANEKRKTGGYVFEEKNGVVSMEAEHFFEAQSDLKTKWTVIPNLGRTLSGITLMPNIEKTEESYIRYKMKLNTVKDSVNVRIFFDSTMPFIPEGHKVAVSFQDKTERILNINKDLTWANNYSKMYPAGAARMIETTVTLALPKTSDEFYTLTLKLLDPGIVIYKVIVDLGGFEQTHLKMDESPYKR
ncbi:glycosyl hydrolase 115 family protein [Flavobacterium limnophilum]|uniref:glycosyl hydrolase 115 family protein n=1 Tax=Flavobacterium limnophilum TaxID=3003262 RepID=UPI00248298C4|nr:glycosyl hydrolase 115 family protein [Flavobacterium limnophilum]